MINGFSDLSLDDDGALPDGSFLEDITSKYFSACRDGLALGQLVRLQDFSLQDSIAALEIMDPKMDNGVINMEEPEKPAYDCSAELLPSEILDITDQIFASEMSWHSGSNLSQTLYTCVFVQRVLGKDLTEQRFSKAQAWTKAKHLLDTVLYAYVVGVIKCCEICRDEYLVGYLYEEEDISSADFGLDFLPYTAVDRSVALLEEGIQWLEQEVKVHADQELCGSLTQLLCRMKLRAQFLTLLSTLDSTEKIPRIVENILQEFGRIIPCQVTPDDLLEIFNTRIQRTLASTTPPRPLMSITVQEAYNVFERVCKDMVRILPADGPARDSPTCMLAFFDLFRSEVPQSPPLVRSRLQNLFMRDKMAQHHENKKKFLFKAIEETCGRQAILDSKMSKVEVPHDKRFRINQIVDEVSRRLELPYFDLFKVLCHNPGRQRRNLCKILADMDVLQSECEAADEELAHLTGERPKRLSNGHTSIAFTISSWVFNVKLDTSIKLLLIGFETELYRPFEWGMMYWHINNLVSLQSEHLYSILVDRLSTSNQEQDEATRTHLAFVLMYNESLGSLCQAYMQFVAALSRSGAIRVPNLKYSSEALLYAHRMRPWTNLVSPPAVDYETYSNETRWMKETSAQALFERAGQTFNVARTKFMDMAKRGPSRRCAGESYLVTAFKSEMKGFIGCCIANTLLVQVLVKHPASWWTGKKVTWQKGKFSRFFPSIAVE